MTTIAQTLYKQSLVKLDSGFLEDAVLLCKEAIRLVPTEGLYWLQAGRVYAASCDLTEAERCLQSADRLLNSMSDSAWELARLYTTKMGREDEAVELCIRALSNTPTEFLGYLELARAILSRRTLPEAIALLPAVAQRVPFRSRFIHAIAIVLFNSTRYSEARLWCEGILRREPTNPIVESILAGVFIAERDLRAAERGFQRAISLAPVDQFVVTKYVQFLCMTNRYTEAAAFFRAGGYNARFHGRRMWNGEPVEGKVIRFRGTGKFGDEIQFARFAASVNMQGGTALLQTHESLHGLFRSLSGLPSILDRYQDCPACDFESDPMTHHLAMDVEPGILGKYVPYLHLQESTAMADCRIGERPLRIGLCWHGGTEDWPGEARRRAIPLTELVPMTQIHNVLFVSLQVNPSVAVGASTGDTLGPLFVRPPRSGNTFEETAALILTCDVVVSIDTACAHLAGALGKRTFLLLPFTACWRWPLNHDTTPWYPTTRLFRQRSPGNWRDVIDEVMIAIQDVLAERDSQR